MSQYVNYIKFAAKSVINQVGDIPGVDTQDLFQEGQLVMYNCWLRYGDKPANQFGAILKASIWRKLREIAARKQFILVDIEDAYDIGYDENTVDEIYAEQKLKHLAEMLKDNPLALTILREFIKPSARTLWEAKMSVARKEMLKSQNYRVSVPKDVHPTKDTIRRAMGVTKVKFDESFAALKRACEKVYFGEPDSGLIQSAM